MCPTIDTTPEGEDQGRSAIRESLEAGRKTSTMTEGSGFGAFCLYQCLKLHFTSKSYDAIKYNFKTNVSQTTFLKNKGKYHFYRLSRKYTKDELKDFFVANFVYGDSTWIGELTGPDGEAAYKKWSKINQSLSYIFENDVLGLVGTSPPEEMLMVRQGQYPQLLSEVMLGTVKVETLVILNSIMNFFPMWTKKITDDVVWPAWRIKIEKYTPFVAFDKDKFKNILKEVILEHA